RNSTTASATTTTRAGSTPCSHKENRSKQNHRTTPRQRERSRDMSKTRTAKAAKSAANPPVQQPAGEAGKPGFKPKKSVALSGVVAGNTALCTVGKSGNDLHYRGYDILDVADVCEF